MKNYNETTRHDIKVSIVRRKFETFEDMVRCEIQYILKVPETCISVRNKKLKPGHKVDVNVRNTYIFETSETPRVLIAEGFACCRSDDKFNKVTGRRIAQARATVEMYRQAKELLRRYVVPTAETVLSAYNDFENKADSVITKDKQFIQEMSQSSEKNLDWD